MMCNTIQSAAAFTIALATLVCNTNAQEIIQTKRLVTGLSSPLYVTAAPGDNDHLFVVEQHSGQIRILNLDDNTIESTPFLTIGGLATGGEQGLLGLAFHPDY